jgi:hypothetical protein
MLQAFHLLVLIHRPERYMPMPIEATPLLHLHFLVHDVGSSIILRVVLVKMAAATKATMMGMLVKPGR